METRFQTTSFIPKTSLDNIVSGDGHLQDKNKSQTTSLLTLFCFFVFVCSLVSAGVVLSLSKLAKVSQADVEKDLIAYQGENNTVTILELKTLQDRLNLIENLIKNHVAVSSLFEKIAENTLTQVAFTSFDIKKKNDNSYILSLKAQGIGYESIVAQDKQFSSPSAQRVFKNTSITDFNKPKGQDFANFTITTTIASPAVNFYAIISGAEKNNINTAK